MFIFQQSFEALSDRAVAVVVDPIQSVKGKVYDIFIYYSLVTVNKILIFTFKYSVADPGFVQRGFLYTVLY